MIFNVLIFWHPYLSLYPVTE